MVVGSSNTRGSTPWSTPVFLYQHLLVQHLFWCLNTKADLFTNVDPQTLEQGHLPAATNPIQSDSSDSSDNQGSKMSQWSYPVPWYPIDGAVVHTSTNVPSSPLHVVVSACHNRIPVFYDIHYTCLLKDLTAHLGLASIVSCATR